MPIFKIPLAALSWLGRQGTRAVAALIVIDIALPSLGTLLEPYLAWAVFALLCTASIRVDMIALRGYMRRPAPVITGIAWTSFGVPVLFVFVAAIMENVGLRFITTPRVALELTLLGFAVFFALLLTTALIFMPTGRKQALALAFLTSQRNLGLMLAATGGALPELTWLYFAIAQFPLYTAPFLLQPLVRTILESSPRRRE